MHILMNFITSVEKQSNHSEISKYKMLNRGEKNIYSQMQVHTLKFNVVN